MPNGASFGALTYWKAEVGGEYRVTWMDGTGRMQTLEAFRDPATGLVSATYLDELAENGPEWRRWEFEVAGEDFYLERLFARPNGSWELLTEWSFRRTPL